MTPLLRTFAVGTALFAGLYLGLSSILAIPLIDEDKTKTKELSLTLKEELNTLKNSFVAHVSELKYDTLTLARFDSINSIIGYNNNATSLQSNLNNRILNQKLILENQVDVLYYYFMAEDLPGINKKKIFRNEILQDFKLLISKAEYELFQNVMAVRINVLRLYTIAKKDNSPSFQISRTEFDKLFQMLINDPVKSDTIQKTRHQPGNPVLTFFFLSNIVVKDESQTLAVIIGLIGLGLLGAVIGTFGKYFSAEDDLSRQRVFSGLFATIVKSFAAAMLSYLSVKGGLSVVSDDNNTNPNPYFILFICFVAAVYSEEIWTWAKTKMFQAK